MMICLAAHSWMEHSSEPGQGQYDQDGVGCEGLESGGCSFSIEYVSFVGEQPESTLPSMSSFTFFSPSPATTQNNNTHETNEKLRGTSSPFFLPGLLFIVYIPSINGKDMSSNLRTKL